MGSVEGSGDAAAAESRAVASALQLARWLQSHPAVARVLYTGLESHPQLLWRKRQQSGFGAVVAFELKATQSEAASAPGD